MMTKMNDIEFYTSLKPRKYPYVECLLITQTVIFGSDRICIRLELCLKSSLSGDGNKIRLFFNNIVDLHINPHYFPFAISLLEIYPMKSAQWEEVNFKVKDTEEEKISFFCESFSVIPL